MSRYVEITLNEFKKEIENPLPFTDSKPNENMFDYLNLQNTRETGDNDE